MVQVWLRNRAVFALGAHWLLLSQMLLDFTKSEREVVRDRAVGRIGVLTNLMSSYCSLKVRTRHPPGRPCPPPCHSPCQGCCPAGSSKRWGHRALTSQFTGNPALAHSGVQVFGTSFLLLALLLMPPSTRPLSALEETVLDLSALKTSQSQP